MQSNPIEIRVLGGVPGSSDWIIELINNLNLGYYDIIIQQSTEKTKDSVAFYWAGVVRPIANHTGHEEDDIHEYLLGMFAPKELMIKGDLEIIKPIRTSKMGFAQFYQYVEKCVAFANSLGIIV